MKSIMTALGSLMAWTTPAIAAGAADTTGTSLITILLMGFGAMIVVGQLIPAIVILGGMAKAALGKTRPAE